MKPSALIALLVALAIAVVPAALASGPRTGAVYVGLGDSYAAGEGLGPFQSGTDVKKGSHRNQCHRSQGLAYADLVPAVVLPTVTSRAFWACSGATISDIETAPSQTGPSEQYQQPEQTQAVGPTTQWISLSVGGDDLGFGAIGTACGGAELSHLRFQRLPGQPSCAQEIAAQASKLGKLKRRLEGLYIRLLTDAPQAKLVVVGYPRIFPSSYKGLPVYQGRPFCILDHYPGPLTVDVGMPASDAQAIDQFEVQLNSTIHRATMLTTHPADAARIEYADTYDPSVPRNCKGTTPHASVAGLTLSPGFHGVGPWYKALIGSGTFHPTDDGQRMMADVVEATFNSFPNSASIDVVTAPGHQAVSVAGVRLTKNEAALPGVIPALRSALGAWITCYPDTPNSWWSAGFRRPPIVITFSGGAPCDQANDSPVTSLQDSYAGLGPVVDTDLGAVRIGTPYDAAPVTLRHALRVILREQDTATQGQVWYGFPLQDPCSHRMLPIGQRGQQTNAELALQVSEPSGLVVGFAVNLLAGVCEG